MRMFHKSKDSRSKDKTKIEFRFILPTMKTNANKRVRFRG